MEKGKGINVLLVYIYIISASWTGIFKLNYIFGIPNIVLFLLIISSAVGAFFVRRKVCLIFYPEDLLLIFTLFGITVAFMIKGGNINYIYAYIYVFCFSYLFLRNIMCNINFLKLLRINMVGVCIVALFSCVEFAGHCIYNYNVRSLLVPKDKLLEASYLLNFHRSYGLSNEPTQLGFYLNGLGLIAILYIFKYTSYNFWKKLFLLFLIVFAWMTTFSAATFVSLIISSFIIFTVTYITKKRKRFKVAYVFLIYILIFIILFITLMHFNKIIEFIYPLVEKIFSIKNGDKNYERTNLWARAVYRFLEQPFWGDGAGSSTIKYGGSAVNWYLTFIVEFGMIPFIPLISFFIVKIIRVCKYCKGDMLFLGISVLTVVIHMVAISSFYDPPMWLLLVFFDINLIKLKREIKNEEAPFFN